jgi:hypothetical protein
MMNEVITINREHHWSDLEFPEYFAYPTYKIGPFNDFNRDIIEPNTDEEIPEGAVLVRNDDGFWIIANLPYDTYKDKTIQEIVAEFWPDVKDPVFNPDSSDPWWNEFWETAAIYKVIGKLEGE